MSDFFMGIDASKGYADFIILDRTKKIIEEVFQLDDTFEGHNNLYILLKKFYSYYPGATLYTAIESTGGLENNWLNMLYRLTDTMNIKTARINPVGPNALHKAALQRNNSDAISARKIAEYLIAYPEKVNYNVKDPYITLRKQYNLIEMFKKQKTQYLNQLSILLYTSMPYLVRYCKDGIPNWMLQLLVKYPSSEKLARARENSVSNIPYISHNRAGTLIAEARESVGSADDHTTAFVVKAAVQQIIHLKKIINQHKQYMEKHCNLSEVKLLESTPGIGRYSAIGLILNIVSIERFPSAKHLASYFGLHPVYKESGDGSGGYRMSKKGRVVPRQILFMVARTAIIHNPLIKDIYIEQLKKSKTKMAAIGVCMHKILRICFGILKNKKPYDPKVDELNRNKTYLFKSKNKQTKNIKRRYQSITEDAPISRRQNKKRKGKRSQFADSEICGIDVSPSVV